MREQTEGIGVALEVGKVVPEDRRHFTLKICTSAFEEIGLHGLLAAMAERRIAQVVGKAGGRHNLSDLLEQRILKFWVALGEYPGYIIAQRHAHTGYLQRVGEAVVDEDAAREGEHLCLVLQTTERSGENQTVVVAFKLRTIVVALGVAVFLPKALIGYQLLPIHHNLGAKVTNFA